jgi:predicted  nucleic acid-binding Zn-ribbon protein
MLCGTFSASEAQSISSFSADSLIQKAKTYQRLPDSAEANLARLQQLPSRYFSKVSSKANLFNRRLTRSTEKALRRLQKQEEKINHKLSKVDSIAAKGLALGNSIDSLSHLEDLVKGKVVHLTSKIPGGRYIPYLDSLQTSLNFLNKYQSQLNGLKGVEGDIRQGTGTLRQAQGDMQQAQSDMQQLEGKLDQVQNIRQYIQQRQQLLTQTLSKYGSLFTRNIGDINKEVYYYKATIENYKQLWQHPDQAEAKAMEILNKVPAFTRFMQQHSMIAGLFRIPSNYGSAGSVAGLQTRSMVEREIQQRLQEAGAGGRQQIQQQMQQARQQLQQLQNKLAGAGSSSAAMPDFKPNDLKSKTVLQRLSYGTNFQFEKSTGWYPTTSDIAAQIGYKFSKKGEAGIGASFKLGWGSFGSAQEPFIRKIHFTAQGLGLRSYLDYKIKGTIYINGGFEFNYNTTIPDSEPSEPALKNWNGWTKSALLGIERKYKISNKVNGTVMLLFNFLYKQQVRETRSPLVFRMGYNF